MDPPWGTFCQITVTSCWLLYFFIIYHCCYCCEPWNGSFMLKTICGCFEKKIALSVCYCFQPGWSFGARTLCRDPNWVARWFSTPRASNQLHRRWQYLTGIQRRHISAARIWEIGPMHFVFFGCFYSVIKPLPLSWVLISDGAIFLYANVICKLCRLGGRFFCLLPEHSCPSLADWPSSAIMLLRYAAYGCPRYFLPMKNLPPPSEIYASNGG